MNTLDLLKTAVIRASSWGLPLKLLLSAALSAAVGSGVLSLLFEYSTYSYALYFGFRPPVEGIPHLRATVVGGSFLMLVTGAIVAAGLVAAVRPRLEFVNVSAQTHKTLGLAALAIAVSLSVLFVGLTLVSDSLATKSTGLVVGAVVGVFVGVATVALSAWRPELGWWIPILAVAVYYLVILAQLFTPSTHAGLLRRAGFGGGTPVTLRIDTGYTEPALRVSGYLMLRTKDNLILLSSDRLSFNEYPLLRVVSVTYDVDSLKSASYLLPK